ncbi:hypothetical protein DOTSEDRAFT_75479 [Dothistroma septosporum NZE10]|uniref:Uncharacterized protein n=1 Tax=Dothistroma septosporum (strain NZE10 / CBS 128990) TaxID=675120 RepID=M2Y098_DOTSN|nr:hypothetical protein DOTSEDRAFT_75479 [Dothistroma septosporum NZE10]
MAKLPRRYKTWSLLALQLVAFLLLFAIYWSYLPSRASTSGLPDSTLPRSRVRRPRSVAQRILAPDGDQHTDRDTEGEHARTKDGLLAVEASKEQAQAEDGEDGEDDEKLQNDDDDLYDQDATAIPFRGDYRELFSLTTRDRKYYPIHMDGIGVYNPSLIPHPTKADQWVVIASHPGMGESEALYCALGNLNDVLVCSSAPQKMTPAKSIKSEKCVNGLEYMNFYTGPRDTRMFFGPGAPYVVYGSQSTWTCLGLWLQDVRPLLDIFHIVESVGNKLFKSTTELHRPPPFQAIEKNFFVFWSGEGKAYAHYDVYPKRSFAQIEMDGTVGKDLAPQAARHDKFCMAKYMPVPLSKLEDIHQATNSLSITLCGRFDPNCKPSDDNTFIMTIFQHKTCYDYHSIYEPYVALFRRTAPFELHAVGQRPFWIHGRGNLTKETHAKEYEKHPEKIPKGHSEMFYMTSISWKKHGRTYFGHVDDELWLTFGIEDSRAAAIDIVAKDLVADLAFC